MLISFLIKDWSVLMSGFALPQDFKKCSCNGSALLKQRNTQTWKYLTLNQEQCRYWEWTINTGEIFQMCIHQQPNPAGWAHKFISLHSCWQFLEFLHGIWKTHPKLNPLIQVGKKQCMSHTWLVHTILGSFWLSHFAENVTQPSSSLSMLFTKPEHE